jgi:hypothetical protein
MPLTAALPGVLQQIEAELAAAHAKPDHPAIESAGVGSPN